MCYAFSIIVTMGLDIAVIFAIIGTQDKPVHNYDGEIDTWDMAWTFPNALLFTVTIMTTVGYGHISPKSSSGV